MGKKLRAIRRAALSGARELKGLSEAGLWTSFEGHRLAAMVLIAASPLVAYWLSTLKNPIWIVLVLLLQLGIAAATWGIGEARVHTLEEERIESRQETLVALGDTLDPVAVELSKLSALTRPDRRTERSGLVQLILAAATGLGPEGSRPRACYFRLDGTTGTRRLVHQSSVGRSVAAKAEFGEGTLAGDTALNMVDTGGDLFCDDVDQNPPPGWEPTERGEYKTFISVTAAAGPTPYGMLTLDATEVGSLTAEDVQLLRVLGHILGTVEALSE